MDIDKKQDVFLEIIIPSVSIATVELQVQGKCLPITMNLCLCCYKSTISCSSLFGLRREYAEYGLARIGIEGCTRMGLNQSV